MTGAHRANLSPLQLVEQGLPPLKVRIELSFPQNSPTGEDAGSRYSVLVNEGALQDIAISHLISMLKKLMFSFGRDSLRSALDAIERLGALKALAQAGPLQAPRPGGCEFLNHGEVPEKKESSSPKSLTNMANDWARSVNPFAIGRSRRNEANRSATEENIDTGKEAEMDEADAVVATQSLPLGIFSRSTKESSRRSSRNRSARQQNGAGSGSANSGSVTRSSTRSDVQGSEADADNFVKDLPLTLAPAARASGGSTALVLSPTTDPRSRQRKEKVEEEEDAFTLPSIAELPEMEEFAPGTDRTFGASASATLGNPRSRRPSSRCANDFGNRDYLCFQAGPEDGEPPNAPYLPGEVWPTPGGRRPSESTPTSPVPSVEWLLQLREASSDKDDGPPPVGVGLRV